MFWEKAGDAVNEEVLWKRVFMEASEILCRL